MYLSIFFLEKKENIKKQNVQSCQGLASKFSEQTQSSVLK